MALRMGDFDPDGVLIRVEWELFVPGASVFVPAVDVRKLRQQMRHYAKHQKWRVELRDRIEGGKQGVRMWRIS